MQTLEKIVQRASAVGAKMWCLFFCLFFVFVLFVVLFLLTGQKSGFSPPTGDSLHRFR